MLHMAHQFMTILSIFTKTIEAISLISLEHSYI